MKATFVDAAAPMQVVLQPKTEGGMRRQYIPAKLADNPALLENDPDYADRLEGLGNAELVRAMKDGDWSIVAGGMFDDVWRESIHAIKPFEIPSSWRIDRSFDWGSSKPFSVGWWAECDGSPATLADGTVKHYPRGTLFRIGEWYGWTGRPDEGLKQSDSATAQGITLREKQMGIALRVKPGPADNATFPLLVTVKTPTGEAEINLVAKHLPMTQWAAMRDKHDYDHWVDGVKAIADGALIVSRVVN